ncbi:hypothetical protein ES332_D08G078300v1 [Gossypium tomentosum]|uniref:DUF4371 domain-containing protein n=1 Tax=Gossypium tomentosum TaxID=34277 RepID=A0A5D2JS60_GOSTO|nr:hypothetical protein ES332_D08G078300v1 [Gossypium tomentosum]
MCGEFNGLQALILNECKYVSYVYCYSHYLRLVLAAVDREVFEVNQNFKDLYDINHMASSSSKRNDELQKAQAYSINRINQIGILQHPISTTKDLIQKLRDNEWDELLNNVISFCNTWELDVLEMNARYIVGCGRKKKEDVTIEHRYRVDIYFAAIDNQLQELNHRFTEHIVEHLTLTISLDPKEFFKLFDIDKINCTLINKLDFVEKMEDDFLRNSLVVYVEKEIIKKN